MAWEIVKNGTPTQVIAAVNALNVTDQTAAQNAQLVRAKAVIIAEINAVGGSYVELIATGALVSGNSSIDLQVGPVPFVDTAGMQTTELAPNPLP